MVYRMGLRARRQFMNELKSETFITGKIFHLWAKTKRGRDSSIVPPLLPDKKQPRDELRLLQPLKSVSLWLPLFTRFREKLCTFFLSSVSRMKMWVRKCQSHRQAVKSSRPSASDLASSDFSISPPSVWKRSCRRRENLPRLSSRPNKAAIISLFASCSIWAVMADTLLSVRKPLLQRRGPSQVARQRCYILSARVWIS